MASRDFLICPEDREVLVYFKAGGGEVVALMRRHWFADSATESHQGWQSTWDGREAPRDWVAYAWAFPDQVDPAG